MLNMTAEFGRARDQYQPVTGLKEDLQSEGRIAGVGRPYVMVL